MKIDIEIEDRKKKILVVEMKIIHAIRIYQPG